jgi:transposase InsO family protein
VTRWAFWPTYVLVAIDHFSRKIVSVMPLEGPNAGWMIEAMTESFEKHGSPKHIVSDQEPVFRSGAFSDLLEKSEI